MWFYSQIVFYGLASAVAVLAAAFSPHDADRRERLALLIFAGWATANAAHDMLWWIALDALIAATILFVYMGKPSQWLKWLYGIFLMQLFCHAYYHTALAFGADLLYGYIAALNALFLCQLIVVSIPITGNGLHVFSIRGFLSSLGGRRYGVLVQTR